MLKLIFVALYAHLWRVGVRDSWQRSPEALLDYIHDHTVLDAIHEIPVQELCLDIIIADDGNVNVLHINIHISTTTHTTIHVHGILGLDVVVAECAFINKTKVFNKYMYYLCS